MGEKSSKEKFRELHQRQEELKRMQGIPSQYAADNTENQKRLKKENRQKKRKEQTVHTAGRKPANSAEGDRKKKSWGLILGITAGCLILAAGIGFYGWKAYYYRDKFFRGTSINHVKCDELTVEQVEGLIREQVEDYRLQVQFRDDVTEEITGQEIDYKYVSDGGVERILKKQNPILWVSGYFKTKEYEVNENISFSEDKLKTKLESLDSMQAGAQKAPEDAYVIFEKDSFVIKDEVYGTTLKEDTLLDAIAAAVGESSAAVSAEEAGAYVAPELTKDSGELARERDQLNGLVKASITYELPKENKVLDGNELKEWLDVDAEGNYSRDEDKFDEKIAEYVEQLAEEVNTLGKERDFHTTSGLDVKVKGGDYGWKINQKAEIKALTENLNKQEVVTRKPEYSSEELYTENNGLGNTYIELNLTEQYLYYYKDGQLVLDTPFVSGKMTRDRFTPPGVFLLTYKTTDRVLLGAPLANGEPSYRSHVNFWMPFNGGIGLHDASWRSKYGGTIYKYSGSHGCINLPYNKAKSIYEMIDKKTPIVCVYNNGYNLIG